MLTKRRQLVNLVRKRTNKYNARKTEVDGIVFDSQAEAHRWVQLNLLLRAGHIRNLQRQVKYPLEVSTPEGPPQRIGSYYADFVYWDNTRRTTVVEDVKGYKTPLYRWKKKHVEAQYGIEIVETTSIEK